MLCEREWKKSVSFRKVYDRHTNMYVLKYNSDFWFLLIKVNKIDYDTWGKYHLYHHQLKIIFLVRIYLSSIVLSKNKYIHTQDYIYMCSAIVLILFFLLTSYYFNYTVFYANFKYIFFLLWRKKSIFLIEILRIVRNLIIDHFVFFVICFYIYFFLFAIQMPIVWFKVKVKPL